MQISEVIINQVQENGFYFFDKLSMKFFGRFGINVLSVMVLLRYVYYPIYHKKDFIFTFFMFNITIFFITYLLNKVELSMGAAFGLFAVFSMLRYRTEGISAKDMTYLFMVIAMGLVSAVNKGTYFETVLINAIVILSAFALDGSQIIRNEAFHKIEYENIEMIKPENEELLIQDLRKRTGLLIHKVVINKINFLRDSATVTAYYYKKPKENPLS